MRKSIMNSKVLFNKAIIKKAKFALHEHSKPGEVHAMESTCGSTGAKHITAAAKKHVEQNGSQFANREKRSPETFM